VANKKNTSASAVQENVGEQARGDSGTHVSPALADTMSDAGEAAVIVGVAEAAKQMYTAAIESLPDASDLEFAGRAAVVLSGLRNLEAALSRAACRSRTTPSVIVALSDVRRRYDDLTARAANSPGSTLGPRLHTVCRRAKLSTLEAANGAGLGVDMLEAVEAEETTTYDVATKVETLIAALGG
jgi:hypothetical protein